MNSLSWFLYLADVLGTFKSLFGVFSILGLFGCLFLTGFLIFELDYNPVKVVLSCFVPWLLVTMVTCAIPSQKTMYMIAASEVSERIYHSKPGQEIAQESLETLKAMLKKLRGEEKK